MLDGLGLLGVQVRPREGGLGDLRTGGGKPRTGKTMQATTCVKRCGRRIVDGSIGEGGGGRGLIRLSIAGLATLAKELARDHLGSGLAQVCAKVWNIIRIFGRSFQDGERWDSE